MQGYLTLATGSRLYVEIALNLALSLKLNDSSRPICLVTDRATHLPETHRRHFDDVVFIGPRDGFHGCLNKLRVHECSPYGETMFVDSDCVLVKNDMDRHWGRFASPGFNIAGSVVTTGNWYGFDIAEVIGKLGIPYMVRMNSGVFYFRAGAATTLFFDTALRLVDEHKELLGSFHRNKLQLADEPFIGAALGTLGVTPIAYNPADGSIMVTTVGCSGASFDPIARHSALMKHADFRLLGRFFPRRRVAHSPSFAHFVKLKPKAEYNKVSNQLRDHFGLPRFAF